MTTKTKPRKLPPKRRAFVREYMIDFNGTQAALRAGYSERTAGVQASRLLTNVQVQEAIQEATAARFRRNEATAERVIEEYRRIAFADTTEAIYIKHGEVHVTDTDLLTDEQKAAIAEISQTKDGIKVKFHSKQAALDALAKHLGLFTEAGMGLNVNLNMPPPQISIEPVHPPQHAEALDGDVPVESIEGEVLA